MKTKGFFKIMTAVLSLTIVLGVGSKASAASYSLSYASGAPTNTYKLHDDITVKSTGASCITIKSTNFKTRITGAYMDAAGKTLGKNPIITNHGSVNSENPYYLYYIGNSVPKKNISVSVSITLNEYAHSQSVTAKGQINA